MWKKLFVFLLAINLILFTAVILWFGTLPKSTPSKVTVPQTALHAAKVQFSIGQEAVNTYLTYALAEQADIKNVLSYATVAFGNNWQVHLGPKVADRVIPCDVNFAPSVEQGELWLTLQSASIGGIAVPKSLLFYVFRQVAWPSWIVVNGEAQRIEVNLADRPPSGPYRIRALAYSPATRLMTFEISILPKGFQRAHA